MSMSSVAGMTIGLALLAVLVIGLLTYMSALVRKAYELKVELNAVLDRRLAEIEEEAAGRSKKIRREVLDDVAKLKDQLARDVDRLTAEAAAGTAETIAELRRDGEAARVAQAQAIDDLRRRQLELQRALEAVGRDFARMSAAAQPTAPAAPRPVRTHPVPLPPEMDDDAPPTDLRAFPGG